MLCRVVKWPNLSFILSFWGSLLYRSSPLLTFLACCMLKSLRLSLQPEHGPGSTLEILKYRRRELRRLNVIHTNVLLFCQHLNLTDTKK